MIRHRNLGLAVAAMLVFGVAAPAWADCNADIQRMQSQVAKVGDPKVKRLVEYDIKRAKKEATEADPMECQEAVDHADKLMAPPAP